MLTAVDGCGEHNTSSRVRPSDTKDASDILLLTATLDKDLSRRLVKLPGV